MFSDLFYKLKSKFTSSDETSEHKHRHDRNIYDVFKKVFDFRKQFAIALTVMFSISATIAYAAPQSFEVAIIDGNEYYEMTTSTTTVAEVLKDRGIEVSEYDIVSPDMDTRISSSQTIVVQRLNKVTLTCDGETKEYFSTAKTVGEFLDEKDIDLNYHDMINIPVDENLAGDTKLKITRVVKRILEVNEEIPYKTKTVADTSMSISDSKIVTKGVAGIDCQTYEVMMYDGVEVSRNLISTERISEPQDEVKAIGTKGGRVTEKGEDFSYSKVITCSATAYDLSFQSCGKRPGDRGYGITASGTYAKPGTVAVDPRVIPLGTRMYIESADGSFVYGYCVAEDTGGAIKGNKVDLFFNTTSECYQFGRRSVNVYILD